MKSLLSRALLVAVLTSCASNDVSDSSADSLDSLFASRGLPQGTSVRTDGEVVEERADVPMPSRIDLRAFSGAARNQGSRGTCSVFASIGLVETFANIYLRDYGWTLSADLSEQDLYYRSFDFRWSLAQNASSASDIEGHYVSDIFRKLDEYGAVLESDWPYEADSWFSLGTNGCTGDGAAQRPECFTNGTPSYSADSSRRLVILGARALSPYALIMRNHLATRHTPIVVNFSFASNAWGRYDASSGTYANVNVVGYPTNEPTPDDVDSAHAVLVVGYDRDKIVPRHDAQGRLTNQTERGALIIKNSWGPDWGGANAEGGYGYISYDYANALATEAWIATDIRRASDPR